MAKKTISCKNNIYEMWWFRSASLSYFFLLHLLLWDLSVLDHFIFVMSFGRKAVLSCALIHLISPGAAPTVTRLSKAPQVTAMWEKLLTLVLPTFAVFDTSLNFFATTAGQITDAELT